MGACYLLVTRILVWNRMPVEQKMEARTAVEQAKALETKGIHLSTIVNAHEKSRENGKEEITDEKEEEIKEK